MVLIAANRVVYIVHSDIDKANIVSKLEVVRRAVLRKTHHVFSTTIYGSMMVLCPAPRDSAMSRGKAKLFTGGILCMKDTPGNHSKQRILGRVLTTCFSLDELAALAVVRDVAGHAARDHAGEQTLEGPFLTGSGSHDGVFVVLVGIA